MKATKPPAKTAAKVVKPAVETAPLAAPNVAPEQIAYYGVYLRQAKLGNAVMRRNDNATLNGKPAVQVNMSMTMDLSVLGSPNKIVSENVSWSDPKTGAPMASRSRSEASGRVTTVYTTYTPRSLTYNADIQGTKKTETLTLQPGERFLVDPTNGANIKPTIGMKLSGKVFSDDMMRLFDSEITVVGQETVDIGGQAVRAYKVEQKSALMPATMWTNEAGDMLRADLPMGMQMRKEAKEVALAPSANAKGPDIAVLTSIASTGEPLTKEARKANSITYEISGVTRPLAADDSVQSVTYRPTGPGATEKNEKTATVTVRARPLPASAGAFRFASPDAAPEPLRRFLRSTEYVPASDATFVELARSIVGEERDTAKAAAKIVAYVHSTMKPDPGIAALRTADDIRKDPRGVCRDYTTFYTTLARAAGIPTKQCVGLGFGVLPGGPDGAGMGRFVGHAWPEVWCGTDETGADRWVALEPTWGAPYADATHIKMAEGEITDFYQVAADLGGYKIKVLKVE